MTIHQTTIRPAVTPAEQRFLDLYASVADQLPGARDGNVRVWREDALGRFATLGMPHRRVEDWKYTDLRVLMPQVLPLAGVLPAVAPEFELDGAIGPALAGLDAYRAVFVDGLFRPDLSNIQDSEAVTFERLRTALENSESASNAMAAVSAPERDVIAALASAFATDGAVLTVAGGTKLDKPVHIIFAGGEGHLSALFNVISIGEGAEVSLIETHTGAANSQALSFMQLGIGRQAQVKHVRTNAGGAHAASGSIRLGEGAQYDPLQMTIDGTLTRAQLRIRFEGPHARCHYAGAMMLRGQSHADFTLVVEHAAEACESRELVKAVVDGRSRGVFQGKVVVERGAQKTDGKQMANALLLSDDAEFDSKPELEIFADDVVCGHGATAGQLDEDMLFYLRARGIPERQARSLLVAAFVGEALDRIENETLRAALQEKADAWLAA